MAFVSLLSKKTINVIGKAAPHQKIFLICRTPQTVRKLVEGGIDLKDVNVGNMHFSEGKKQISSKVYVDDQDLTDLRFIKQRGVNVFIQTSLAIKKNKSLTKSKIALILV